MGKSIRMKITFLALCVLLPAFCRSTPLPYSEATTESSAKVKGEGTAEASGQATAQEGAATPTNPTTPYGQPATPPTSQQPTAEAEAESQAKASGQGAEATAQSTAEASSGSGAPTGKPPADQCAEFADYSVVVYNQGDLQKLSGKQWVSWKTTQITSETIQTQVPVCTFRYCSSKCKGMRFSITATSETEAEFTVFGTDETTIVEVKQSATFVTEGFYVFQSQIVEINQATIGSNEVVAVEEKDTIASYLDQIQFAVLDTDFESYIVTVSGGEERIVCVSVSVDIYEDETKKQEIWQSVSQVITSYNIQESEFVEITSSFEYESYSWDQVTQGGQGGQPTNQQPGQGGQPTNQQPGQGGQPTNQQPGQGGQPTNQQPGQGGQPTNQQPGQGGQPTNQQPATDEQPCTEEQPAPTQPTAKAESEAKASTTGDDSTAKAQSEAKAQTSGYGNPGSDNQPESCDSGEFSEYINGDVTGFEEYSIVVKTEEFFSAINGKTFYLWKITQSTEEITVDDVDVCVDRHACSCSAIKFQYVKEGDCITLKEWGMHETQLLYVQEKITLASQSCLILKAEVENVMKATADTDVAVAVENSEQLVTYLSTTYAILGTDGNSFFIGQTSSESGSLTFIALEENWYNSEEKQQQISQSITEILQQNSIEESSLSVVINGQFSVDTNMYNKVIQTSDVTSEGGHTTAQQETKTEGAGAETTAKTQTEVSQPTPSSGAPATPSSGAPAAPSSAKSTSTAEAGTGPSGEKTAKTSTTAETTGNGEAEGKAGAEAY